MPKYHVIVYYTTTEEFHWIEAENKQAAIKAIEGKQPNLTETSKKPDDILVEDVEEEVA